jgi:hypothetical protein
MNQDVDMTEQQQLEKPVEYEDMNSNMVINTAAGGKETQKKSSHRMFLDDVEYLSFFRRLSWSPDGSFFLTPASVYQDLS